MALEMAARRTVDTDTASSVRDRILDAAEALLLSDGPSALVLDAVARKAGVSKGGLLYHFPAKDALVGGLIDRMLDNFDREQNALATADTEPVGRWTRAYLTSTVTEDGKPADNSAQLMAGILAAIGNDPKRLQVVRQRFAKWHKRLATDGIDLTHATIVRLAADGLWLSALLGLPGLDAKTYARVLAALTELSKK